MNKIIKQAFTLIELLVVIAIIGILSGLIVVSMSGVTQKANIAKAQVFSNSLRNSLMANIVGEWKFDDITNYTESNGIKTIGTTSSNISDSWNGNHRTASGGPVLKEGNDCVLGKCILFDNSNDYINCGNGTSLNLANIITISAWVKSSSFVANMVVLGKGYWNTQKSYMLQFESTTTLGFYSSAGNISWVHGGEWTHGKWRHVLATINGSSGKLYVDGVQKALNNSIGTIPTVGSNLFIGVQSDNTSYADYFSGSIDDVRIFNAVASISQIKEQYFAGLNSLLFNGSMSKEEYLSRINSIASNE